MTEADTYAWHVVGDRAGIPQSPRTQRLGELLTGLLQADLPLTDYEVVQDDEDRMRLIAWDMTPDPDDPVELLNPRSAVSCLDTGHGSHCRCIATGRSWGSSCTAKPMCFFT